MIVELLNRDKNEKEKKNERGVSSPGSVVHIVESFQGDVFINEPWNNAELDDSNQN